jgi:hypothetical protein
MADHGAISRKKLYATKANPPRHHKVQERFYIDDWSKVRVVTTGGLNIFEGCFTILRINNTPILGFSSHENQLSFYANICDASGRPLLSIDANDWVANVDDVWDCEVTSNRITIRDKSRPPYFVTYKVDADRATVHLDFRLSSHGIDVSADNEFLKLGGIHHHFRGFVFSHVQTVFNLYQDSDGQWKAGFPNPSAII